MPNPLGWYAKTKSEGAMRVLAMGASGLVIRIANPYRAHPVGKTDFSHKILATLVSGRDVKAPTDQVFVPTFIDDIADALGGNADGAQRVVGVGVGTDPLGQSAVDSICGVSLVPI